MEKPIDAVSFFKTRLATREFPCFLKSSWFRKLHWRLIGLDAWREGVLPLGWALQNFLPSGRQDPGVGLVLNAWLDKKLDALFEREGIYRSGSVEVFGHPFLPPPEPTRVHAWRATFELLSQSIFQDQYQARRFLKEDSIVIDAGANAGTFAVFAANLAPKGNVFSFEPASRTYEVVRQNVSFYKNAEAINSALGDRQGSAELLLDKGNTGSNTLADSGRGSREEALGTEKIAITTLDQFVKARNLPRVDFIKMDTEGYEAQILAGAHETIKAYRPVIAMSAYHRAGDRQKLPALVQSIEKSYTCTLFKESEEDLICVAR